MSLPAHRPHALNALFEALGGVVIPNSCDLVVLAGHLAHDRLRAAIEATLARHPVLAGKPFELRVHPLTDDDPAQIDAHLLRLIWSERFTDDRAPVRFHVTETPSRTYLQTIHTHVYADATACYLLTEQVAAAYAARSPKNAGSSGPAAPSAPPPLWSSAPRAPGPRARRFPQLAGAAQTARDLVAPFAGLATRARTTPGDRRLARFTFSPAQTEQLRRAARARGCSMHAFFQLAFLRAAIDFNGARGVSRPRLRLWDFFSVRPLREGGGDRYDCLALVYPVDLDARGSDDEVLRRCARTVERMRDGEIFTHDARFAQLFSIFGKVAPLRWFSRLWPVMFKSNVLLTNPGVCPSRLPTFGELPVLDYVTFPQLLHPAELMLVFSTFRDGLRVLAVYDEGALGASFHRDLFEPFLDRLSALAGLDLSPASTRDGFVARWVAATVDDRISA